jgi:hypothetical protein
MSHLFLSRNMVVPTGRGALTCARPTRRSCMGARARTGALIGPYCGTVRTEEEWESDYCDSHYCVVANDGASGVVVDGGEGQTNVLQFLNHTCAPHCTVRCYVRE